MKTALITEVPTRFEDEYPEASQILSEICSSRMIKKEAGKYQTPLDLDNLPVFAGVKIKRNDPCPCNSGKKYKKCCIMK